ncbi:MAG: PAS domain-containing sensor histidine kinase [Bacteroidia bacterium]
METNDIDSLFFKTAVHQCNDLVVITDDSASVIYVNPAFEKHTGYKLKSIKGKNISILKSGYHNNTFYRNLWQTLKKGLPKTTVFLNKKKNGEIFYDLKTITPIFNEKGKITHYLSTSKDVSVERNLQRHSAKQKAFINTILQKTDALIVCLDQDGKIKMFNKACQRLTGYTEEELKGKSVCLKLTPESEHSQVKKILNDLRNQKGRQIRNENSWVTKHGKSILISWSHTVIDDEEGKTSIILSTGIDITKERKNELELKEFNSSLDKQVKERTNKLSVLSNELLNANEFIRKINHQLPALVYLIDKERSIIKLFNNHINDKVALPLRTDVELPICSFLQFISDEIKPGSTKLFLDSLDKSIEIPVVINGETHWVENRSLIFKRKKLNSSNQILGFLTDVTESKFIREKLEESQRIAQIGTWEWNLINNEIFWSDEIFKIFEIDKRKFKPSYPKFLETIHPEDVEMVTAAVDNSVKNGTPYEVVHRLRVKSNKIKFVREKGYVVYSSVQKPLRMIGTVQDITKEIEMRNKLKTSFDTLENSLNTIFTADLKGKVLSSNAAGIRMFGYGNLALMLYDKPSFFDYWPVNIRKRIRQIFRIALEKGFFYSEIPFTALRSNGEEILVKFNIALVRDANNKPYAFSAALFDVTKQVKIEQEISKYDEKVNLLLENIDEVVFGLDVIGENTMISKVFYLSAKSEELMGFSFEDLAKNPSIWAHSIHPDDFEMVSASNTECIKLKKATTRIYRLRHNKTNEYRWFEERVTPYYDEKKTLKALYGSARDVTKRIEDQNKLKESEEKYRLVSDNNRDMITLRDPRGKAIFVSSSVKQLLGYTVEEYLKTNLFDLMHPYDRDRVRTTTFDPVFQGVHNGLTEGRIKHKNGHYIWLQVLTQPVYDSDGNIIQIVGSSRDVTERKKLEEALIESERKYRSIFDNALVGIFRINIYTQSPLDANDACIKLFGYDSLDDFLKNFKSEERYVDSAERDDIFRNIKVNAFANRDVQFKRKDGSVFWGNASAKLLTEEGILEGIIVDITKSREYEATLQRNLQEKELLLKEIHHRVKNNLQIIISLLKLQLNNIKDENQREPLIESRERIHAIAMIHEKLYLSEDISMINFSEYIANLTKSTQLLHSEKGVKLNFNMEDYYTDVNVSIPLGLMCYEIIANAFKHAFRNIPGPQLDICVKTEGKEVILKIEDNGTGFDTSRLPSSNSLGWKLINNLSRQINAKLEIVSKPGRGTSVKIKTGGKK